MCEVMNEVSRGVGTRLALDIDASGVMNMGKNSMHMTVHRASEAENHYQFRIGQ